MFKTRKNLFLCFFFGAPAVYPVLPSTGGGNEAQNIVIFTTINAFDALASNTAKTAASNIVKTILINSLLGGANPNLIVKPSEGVSLLDFANGLGKLDLLMTLWTVGVDINTLSCIKVDQFLPDGSRDLSTLYRVGTAEELATEKELLSVMFNEMALEIIEAIARGFPVEGNDV